MDRFSAPPFAIRFFLQFFLLCLFTFATALLPGAARGADEYWRAPLEFMKTGDFSAALEELERLLEERPGDVLLLRLKGISQLELDRVGEAVETLRLATQGDPDNEAARFYYAKSLAYAGRLEQAIDELEELQRRSPASPYAEQAGTVIENLQSLLVSADARPESKRWDLYARVAGEHDDNIPARPDPDAGPSSSYRAVASACYELRVVEEELDDAFATAGLSLSAYGSRYARKEFDEYNLNVVSAGLFTKKNLSLGSRPAELALDFGYTVTELGHDPFSTAWNSGLRFDVQCADSVVISSHYSLTWQDFEEDTLWPYLFSRDGRDHGLGADLYFYLLDNRLIVSAGYLYNTSDTEGSQLEVEGHAYSGSLTFRLPLQLVLSGSLCYSEDEYVDFSPEPERLDDVVTVTTSLSRYIWKDNLNLEISYSHTRADSNLAFAEYRRNIIGLSVAARF